jgi:tRNA A37 methylthiotransferase MiaB
MKVRTLKQNKVNVITLGCSKNLVDSEVLMGQLRANDFQVTHEAKKSDARKASTPFCATRMRKRPVSSKNCT